MYFDLRTTDSAYEFVLSILNMDSEEFINDYIINCDKDFEVFWEKHFHIVKDIDINQIRVYAFHICGSVDNCRTIQQNGLQNLQVMLNTDSAMSRIFENHGLTFNIEQRVMLYNGQEYNIDYEIYRNRHFLHGTDEYLKSIAYRVYYDYCVNGFMCNDNVFSYGTNIHERPEFICDIVQMFPELSIIETEWKQQMNSYRIDFYTYLYQLHRFNFELDNYRDPPYDNWSNLSDNTKIIKWMLAHAIDRAFNDLGVEFIYIKDDTHIPPNQITNYAIIAEN